MPSVGWHRRRRYFDNGSEMGRDGGLGRDCGCHPPKRCRRSEPNHGSPKKAANSLYNVAEHHSPTLSEIPTCLKEDFRTPLFHTYVFYRFSITIQLINLATHIWAPFVGMRETHYCVTIWCIFNFFLSRMVTTDYTLKNHDVFFLFFFYYKFYSNLLNGRNDGVRARRKHSL